jgi:hypothetical protein
VLGVAVVPFSSLILTHSLTRRYYREEACEQYSFGRPVQWGCFCSASSDLLAVKALASPEHSLICKLVVRHGKAVAPYAFLPHTGEV